MSESCSPSGGPAREPLASPPAKRRYVPAVGPRLAKLLFVVFGLFALLVVDSVYLLGVRGLEAATGQTYQNWFYLVLFLLHLVLGALLLVVPAVGFGLVHWWRARTRPNRRAVAVGYALFTAVLLLLASGVVLTRIDGVIVVNDPTVRAVAWWVHVLAPVAVVWLFVLHRLAGKRIRWAVGRRWAAVAAVFAGALLVVQAQDPRRWNMTGPASGEQYFFPSLARTATGDFIPARVARQQRLLRGVPRGHPRALVEQRPPVQLVQQPALPVLGARDPQGRLRARRRRAGGSRLCAGCHDPVPFFSGRLRRPAVRRRERPDRHRPGITCTACHAITARQHRRAATPTTPSRSRSTTRSPSARTRTLALGQPAADQGEAGVPQEDLPQAAAPHDRVLRHLPQGAPAARAQRATSGCAARTTTTRSCSRASRATASPPSTTPTKAEANCNGCHMPPLPSDDFGAKYYDGRARSRSTTTCSRRANTAIAAARRSMPDWAEVVKEHAKFNEGVMRVDLFGVREGGTIDGALTAPLRPEVPALVPGPTLPARDRGPDGEDGPPLHPGHRRLERGLARGDRDQPATGGSAAAAAGPGRRGRSLVALRQRLRARPRRQAHRPAQRAGHLRAALQPPDPARRGRRRPLPAERARAACAGRSRSRWRCATASSTRTYMRLVQGTGFVQRPADPDPGDRPGHLPGGAAAPAVAAATPEPASSRSGSAGTTTASACCCKGGKTRRASSPGRGGLRRGRGARAPRRPAQSGAGLPRAGRGRGRGGRGAGARGAASTRRRRPGRSPGSPALVDKQNGYLDEAIADFEGILARDTGGDAPSAASTSRRTTGCCIELGETLFERARQERGAAKAAAREALLRARRRRARARARARPRERCAHYNLSRVFQELGDAEERPPALRRRSRATASTTTRATARWRSRAPRDPAADHAAEAIVIYDLDRDGAYELPPAGGPALSAAGRTRSTRAASPTTTSRRPTTRSSGARSAVAARSLSLLAAVAAAVFSWAIAAPRSTAVRGGRRRGAARQPLRWRPGAPQALAFSDQTARRGSISCTRPGDRREAPARDRWAAVSRSSTPTATATATCCSSTPGDGRGAAGREPALRLYRNDCRAGAWRFVDVTAESGLGRVTLYGMGVAVGDVDGDARPDLLVTAVGENRLLRNVSAGGAGASSRCPRSGVAGGERRLAHLRDVLRPRPRRRPRPLRLPLRALVAPDRPRGRLPLTGVGRAYGPPTNYEGAHSALYRERRDRALQRRLGGRRASRSRNPATGRPVGKALGVLAQDVDGDGWVDLVVANDTTANFLFRNLGDRRPSRRSGRPPASPTTAWGRRPARWGSTLGAFRDRRRAGDRDRQLRQRDDLVLRQPGRRPALGRRGDRRRHRRAVAPGAHVRRPVLRPRPRRAARPRRRERAPRGGDRARRSEPELPPVGAALLERRPRGAPDLRAARPRQRSAISPGRSWAAGWRRPTSTATAISTSS